MNSIMVHVLDDVRDNGGHEARLKVQGSDSGDGGACACLCSCVLLLLLLLSMVIKSQCPESLDGQGDFGQRIPSSGCN